ncbi:MAG TPA: hypothetical protein VLN44_06490, partial [Pyrinomonadaceae bacterium]|nr:hypothetical protein [Pyrinomonadaceae bacterium]
VTATQAINESAHAQSALQNLYELPLTDNPEAKEAAQRVINRETSEDDTHPSPCDRFRFTRKITSQSEPPISGMVWDLFKDKAGLTKEMTAMLEHQFYLSF